MGYLVWAFDIAGLILFYVTNTVPMYGIAAGVCALGAVIGHLVAQSDGVDVTERVRAFQARNSCIGSVVIIGIWIGLTAAGVFGES